MIGPPAALFRWPTRWLVLETDEQRREAALYIDQKIGSIGPTKSSLTIRNGYESSILQFLDACKSIPTRDASDESPRAGTSPQAMLQKLHSSVEVGIAIVAYRNQYRPQRVKGL